MPWPHLTSVSADEIDRDGLVDGLADVLGVAIDSVEVTATDAFNSCTVRLRVRYHDPAVGLPTALVLKRNAEPVQDAADGSDPSYWRPKMRCLESAVRDWSGLELLG